MNVENAAIYSRWDAYSREEGEAYLIPNSCLSQEVINALTAAQEEELTPLQERTVSSLERKPSSLMSHIQAFAFAKVSHVYSYCYEKMGRDPLHYAARKGDLANVKALVKSGINVNVTDYLQNTSLHMAVENGHMEIARFLLEEGANPNALNSRGSLRHSPLYYAALSNHFEMVQLLVEYRADLNQEIPTPSIGHEGTVMHHLLGTEYKEMRWFFYSLGADLTALNSIGVPAYTHILENLQNS